MLVSVAMMATGRLLRKFLYRKTRAIFILKSIVYCQGEGVGFRVDGGAQEEHYYLQ